MGTHRPETGVHRGSRVRASTAAARRQQRAAAADTLTFSPCSYLPRMFHGPAVVRGTPQEPRRSTADRVTSTLSLCEWLLGSRRLKQKRKLFPGPPPMDASWFPLPGSCTREQQPKKELAPGLASRPGYGISTVFPFATNSQPATKEKTTICSPYCTDGALLASKQAGKLLLLRLGFTHPVTVHHWPLPLTWDKALALGLGATNPCPTDVHMEPFSTSAFKGSLSRLFATTTKICTRGGSRPAHAGSLQRSPLRPSYSPGLGDLGCPPPRGQLGL